jgi:hypothetical protein
MYELYIKQKIVTALKASKEGQILSHEEVKKRFVSR